eukprot:TRINITY_DN60356_c0_g1_i2.p1 TRINITY_DN60356_c0_g1~~TRINITY_DN60356_c0_g1_i2.p1  ORF type:complete len:261 (+),score=58.29 TRINITY_DN60356_c0_g1_i2:100-882(+)
MPLVGGVVKHAANGRVGVALHGQVWCRVAQNDSDSEESVESENVLAVLPKNLRILTVPDSRDRLMSLGCVSEATLMRLLGERGCGLPENVADGIAKLLQVAPVAAGRLDVVGASSSRGDFSLTAVLDPNPRTWWISGAGTFKEGYGEEWLEFAFKDAQRNSEEIRRVSIIGLKIPPLPAGPLSVRDFHLLALRPGRRPDDDDAWVRAPPLLSTVDTAAMQEIAIVPPLDTSRVRLVCISSAVKLRRGGMDCVGLFEVRFA